ncbi:IniB N-terminal domain-containing protein, partial [Pseudonocardia sp. KRD-176]|nr:IniB N-terminal domain-containing protein [Pseudonocardia oceani]
MLAMSQVIEFLLDLMRDEGKMQQFELNPHRTIADAGLQGLTGQDVRDAQLQMSDSGV